MAVTVGEIRRADVGALEWAVNDLESRSSTLVDVAGVIDSVSRMNSWIGEGADGAHREFNAQGLDISDHAACVGALKDTLSDATSRVTLLKSDLTVIEAPASRFDLKVNDSNSVVVTRVADDPQKKAEQDAAKVEVEEAVERLVSDAANLDEDVANVFSQAAAGQITGNGMSTDAAATSGAVQAQMSRSGNDVPQAPSRADAWRTADALRKNPGDAVALQHAADQLTAAGITPEVAAALGRGERVDTLPSGAIDYLESLYDAIPPTPWLELQRSAFARRDKSPLTTFNDGLLILSNENAVDVSHDHGGVSRLPDFTQALLYGKPIDPTTPDLDLRTPNWDLAINEPHSVERKAFNDVYFGQISQASTTRAGSTASLLMIDRAIEGLPPDPVREDAWKASYQSAKNGFVEGHPGADRGDPISGMDSSSQGLVSIASRNGEEMAKLWIADDQGTSDTMTRFLGHHWGDGGKAFGNTMITATHGVIDSPPGSAAYERADTASLALARVLTEDSMMEKFMDMDGTPHSKNIGETNPKLVQAAERALGPSLGKILGYDISDPEWDSFRQPSEIAGRDNDKYPLLRAGHLSTFMQSEDASAIDFSTRSNVLAYQAMADGNPRLSAQISAINDFGADAVAIEMSNDAGAIGQEAYERSIDTRENIISTVQDIAGLTKVGRASIVVNPMIEFVANELFPAADDPTFHPASGNNYAQGGAASQKGSFFALTAAIDNNPLTVDEFNDLTRANGGREVVRTDGTLNSEAFGQSQVRDAVDRILRNRGLSGVVPSYENEGENVYGQLDEELERREK